MPVLKVWNGTAWVPVGGPVGALVASTPLTTHVTTLTTGWTGTIRYQKYGNVVTIWVDVVKTTWATNEFITVTALPLGIRPDSTGPSPVMQASNTSGASEPRSWWIEASSGQVRAAGANSGNIQGFVTYQVAAVETSTAMNSGAETSAITVGTGAGTVQADTKAYVRGGIVIVNVNMSVTAGLAAGSTLFNLPPGFRVADPYLYESLTLLGGTEQSWRVIVWPDGRVTTSLAIPAGTPTLAGSLQFPAALTAAGLGTLLDTGWVNFTPNLPNVPITNNYSKYRRIGNTVHVRSQVTLTGAINLAFIDVPTLQNFASDTPIDITFILGRVRGLRTGVSWYAGDIVPAQMNGGATPSRCSIHLHDGTGNQWGPSTPAVWASGDKWAIDFTYEAVPL